ncbi:phage head spike fiber domain-containing protein [Streptococcus pneumoniae]|uniref:phage head spike fiber domain-containing protein n=5 Tax=Bacilli TaxID=91061 RepID=UPI0005E6D2BA|nr:tail fiber domain-containing protein [Streptococcus pneumoniae]CIT90357.1 PblB [Streptococcus pneumoniae]CJN37458.1 PblB [Streptococcus pneumoniae]COJ55461.1 PblB [Streptococcus pneumoniae]
MDALTRRQFDRAMFAKERTLAIRVGEYASRDIKEASFEYGYIKGDTYKPGGTCAGSGKITFTSIITMFNKLDTLHPEIGLLVGDTYQWVKMGEYFINDIEIDRNRNTTTLELMDGMFKLNREYVTDLHFPAEVREVIQEICLKTGIELANDYFGISAMRYHIEQVPEGKKLSFRDMLSAMTQMIGMSCFFNREGKMEIRDLTESNITINADSYFLHGLTKSEIEYQIAGITCKTDKKSLTVGMKTGRSLELDNVFMTQSALNDLYYKLKNLTYYPYNLNYQGHLLLEVGQWVTIQTNKKETFKVPVLSQSFTFKGGLRGRISADSKAGNDTLYSYEGTITKQIKQQDGVEAKVQAQIEAADKDFDQKVDKIKKDFNDQVELAKARAEEVKRELSDTINQRFNSFDNGPLKEAKRKAEEALRNAGASSSLAQESKRIGLDSVARLEAFKSQTTSAQTALSGDLDALKRTIANDIRPKQAQAETEIAKQVEALSRTKNELAGASTLLAQEAKRIELDSVARLEAFKSQTTSAQTALSGDLDVLKQTIANDIRPKQAQAEAEIAKQVEALSRTKNELAGVKSAQATYKETTTRRLSELTNLANGKASKSELTQTAEELASRIASVQASGRNLFLNSLFKQDISKTGIWTTSTYTATIDSESKYLGHNALKIIGLNPSGRDGGNPKVTYPALGQFGKVIPGSTTNQDVTISFYAKANKNGIMLRSRLGNIGYKTGNVTLSTEIKRYVVHIPKGWTNESKQTTNEWLFNFNQEGTIWIWMPKFEISDVDTSYSEAPEDIEGQISTVESTFKQRANSLDAGVRSLTEGLRTKVDISALNVTAENIRQSVKTLETDTQNKLNQKLSQAEFEVRAGSIRQEILNATKDKASKSELTQTAEELSSKIASVQVGGRNYIRGTKRMMLARGLWASGTFRPSGAGTAKTIDVSDSPVTGFDKAIRLTSSNARDQIGIAQDGFYISQGTYTMSCWVKGRRGQKVKLQTYWQVNDNSGISPIFTLKDENWTKLSFTSARNRAGVASIGYVYLVNAEVGEYLDVLAPQLEDGSLATSSKEAPEDIEGQISTVESTFKQRANSLDAGVRSLTEGLRTKVDISSLNVTAENIRQSVKRLETDTQNKLNQKLSQAEFEVRAGSIRQEILNATKDKASKSELTQTAEELSSKIASVQVGGINLLRNTASLLIGDRSKGCWMSASGGNGRAISVEVLDPPKKMIKNMIRVIENTNGGNKDLTQLVRLRIGEKYTISCYARIASDSPNANVNLLFRSWANNTDLNRKFQKSISHKNWQKYSFTFTADAIENSIQFGQSGAGIIEICAPKIESGTLATDYSEAPEDIEGQISTVESTFKQRANSLDAGVSRLTEGLRTKVDISALNVTAENIRQSVKSLETDTQNKLNQKLSQAEFEVRAGSIRQEILNATKDKADKTLVVSEAGKLREEFSKMKVGGRNLWIKSKTVGAVIEKLPENHVTGQKECYRLENNSTLTFNLEPDFSSRLYQKVTFSAWIKYENVVQGRNFWNVFNCFKHYLFRKNSETGVQSGPDYATLGMYKGSADWKYITFTYDYSEKTNFDQLKTSLRFNLEGATSGTAWVTGIKVEIGSVATDWSPAPEDADGLITEAKATFERTAQGLRTDLLAIQEYVNKDGQRQEALQRYTREESTRQATAVRELVNRDFVGKATYQEDVKGINQRIEAVKTSANKDIASQIASYRQSVDGKFTDISSQITTYKQDVGGQISGLSNRLTSSEQGTTTQISNISNRINSNKQGTDNQISNLKTQVATNKDNAERQMGRISDQVSANKANADSQFANVTNQLARKVETTDFQRVKETSKLYERILGNTENGIADKVARMALTNQLFQVEVAKNASNGQNLLKGTKDFSGGWKNKGANWKKHAEKYKGVDVLFKNNSWNGVGQEIDAKIGEVYTFSLWMKSDWKNDTVNFYVNRNGSVEKGWGVPSETSVAITSEWKRYSFTFKITVDGFIFPRVERLNQNTNLYIAGLKLEKGSYATPYTEAPEDTDEAIRSVQSQLTGSWAVQNINSAGDIISGINLGANGHNRFVGKLTHITGETLIDRAVIKSAMVDKLKTGNFEAGSVTTTILEAEAVTAEKLKVDNALIKKLTATDAFIDQLISKRIFSTKVESVISSSTFLEAYQGRIGGFTLGQFDQGGGRWISGVNQFSVGMGNGAGHGVRTAFWANWGNNWNYAGPKAWNVNTDGKMYCRNEVGFYDQVDFSNSSRANFYGNTTFSRSPVFSNGIELGSKDVLGDGWNPKGGRNAVVWWNQVGSGSVKYWMEQKSDRRLKENITDTAVKALDKINRLRMVAFDFIENKKHEEIGLIAQEAETIVPKIVSRDPENPDGYLHIDYTALVPYLIKAIQELNQKIEKMEKTIA